MLFFVIALYFFLFLFIKTKFDTDTRRLDFKFNDKQLMIIKINFNWVQELNGSNIMLL